MTLARVAGCGWRSKDRDNAQVSDRKLDGPDTETGKSDNRTDAVLSALKTALGQTSPSLNGPDGCPRQNGEFCEADVLVEVPLLWLETKRSPRMSERCAGSSES